ADGSIDQLLVSAPSANKDVLKNVMSFIPPGFPIKVLPSIASVILGKVELSYMRDIDPADLVGRALVKTDQKIISDKAKTKVFLVTGAAGSIGSEIVRQLYSSQAKRVVLFDSWEEGVFNILEELKAEKGNGRPDVVAIIGNIRDKERVAEVFARFRPDSVLH